MMKTLFLSFQILVGLATLPEAFAQTCEQKHRQAATELIQVVQTMPQPKLKNLLLNGERSGINVFTLSSQEQNEMSAIGQRYNSRMEAILARPNCRTTLSSVEAIKQAIRQKNMQNALLLLNSLGGLRGISQQLDRVIASQPQTRTVVAAPLVRVQPQPAPPVPTPTPAVSPRPAPARPASIRPAPARPAARYAHVPPVHSEVVNGGDDEEAPQYSYDQPPREDHGLRPNITLTRYQWQRVQDGRARIIDGYYYHYGSKDHVCENSDTYAPWKCDQYIRDAREYY